MNYIDSAGPQWETLCALEDVLIDSDQNKDWTFVAGHIASYARRRGRVATRLKRSE